MKNTSKAILFAVLLFAGFFNLTTSAVLVTPVLSTVCFYAGILAYFLAVATFASLMRPIFLDQ